MTPATAPARPLPNSRGPVPQLRVEHRCVAQCDGDIGNHYSADFDGQRWHFQRVELVDVLPAVITVGEECDSARFGKARAERNASPAGPLPFAPLASVVASAPPEPDWLWRGYLAPGCITLLAGRPKAGKSSLLCALLGALAAENSIPHDKDNAVRNEFLREPVRPVRAVLLTEERHHTLAEKARRWGIGEHVDVLMRHQARGVEWPEVVRQAVAHAKAVGAALLAVDTLADWAALAGDAENSAGAILEAVRPLQDAAAEGLAVLVVAHQRKAAGEHGDAIRGSSALAGAVDIILELERPSSDTLAESTRVLRALGRFESTRAEVVIKLADAGYEACGDTLAARADAERDKVLAALADADEATSDDLAKATGLPAATVRKRLAEAEAHGAVTRDGEGKRGRPYTYRLTEKIHSAQHDVYRAESNSDPDAEPGVPPPAREGPRRCAFCASPATGKTVVGAPVCRAHGGPPGGTG